jgi:hypothetical protein
LLDGDNEALGIAYTQSQRAKFINRERADNVVGDFLLYERTQM